MQILEMIPKFISAVDEFLADYDKGPEGTNRPQELLEASIAKSFESLRECKNLLWDLRQSLTRDDELASLPDRSTDAERLQDLLGLFATAFQEPLQQMDTAIRYANVTNGQGFATWVFERPPGISEETALLRFESFRGAGIRPIQVLSDIEPISKFERFRAEWQERRSWLEGLASRNALAIEDGVSANALKELHQHERRKRGRPPRPSEDPKKDRRLFEDWKAARATGSRSIKEFANSRGEDSSDVRAALDRHRKRRRSGKK